MFIDTDKNAENKYHLFWLFFMCDVHERRNIHHKIILINKMTFHSLLRINPSKYGEYVRGHKQHYFKPRVFTL